MRLFPDLYANKSRKLDEMNNFIRKNELSKLTPSDRKLMRLISLEEIQETRKYTIKKYQSKMVS